MLYNNTYIVYIIRSHSVVLFKIKNINNRQEKDRKTFLFLKVIREIVTVTIISQGVRYLLKELTLISILSTKTEGSHCHHRVIQKGESMGTLKRKFSPFLLQNYLEQLFYDSYINAHRTFCQ